MAKSRTAPTLFVTVPRLVLQSVIISVRMDSLIKRENDLPIARVLFWTNSRRTALQCIRNETRRLKTYVASRVAEIKDFSKPAQWRHFPGKRILPMMLRWVRLRSFLQKERWLRGPDFLWRSEDAWPSTDIEVLSNGDPELKDEKLIGMMTLPSSIDQLLKIYSSWTVILLLLNQSLKTESHRSAT